MINNNTKNKMIISNMAVIDIIKTTTALLDILKITIMIILQIILDRVEKNTGTEADNKVINLMEEDTEDPDIIIVVEVVEIDKEEVANLKEKEDNIIKLNKN